VVTFLEFNEAPAGVPGDGDIHRLILRVASYDSLEFWMDRFIANDVFSELLRLDPTQPQSIVFHDPEGHEVELMVSDTKDAPLVADADDIPAEHRIRGIEGARSYTTIESMLPYAEYMGFRRDGDRLVFDGQERSGRWYFSEPTGRPSNGRSTTRSSPKPKSPSMNNCLLECRPFQESKQRPLHRRHRYQTIRPAR